MTAFLLGVIVGIAVAAFWLLRDEIAEAFLGL